jgi:hypothetical protein
MTNGRCHCGAVRFRVEGPLRDVAVCHCSVCRMTHGGAATYTACGMDALHMDAAETLRHYEVAEATYSFCGTCGSQLFWRRPSFSHVSISAAAIEPPSHIKTTRHIFVAHAGDYEDLSTDLPKFADYSGSEAIS